MSKLFLFLFLGLAFVSAETLEGVPDRIENFFRGMFEEVKDEIHKVAEEIMKGWDRIFSEGRDKIEDSVEHARTAFMSMPDIPPVDQETLDNHLDAVKRYTVSNFFECRNLTDVLAESGSLIALSLELTANLTANLDVLLQKVSNCTKESVFRQAYCWFSAMSDIKGGWASDWQDISFFEERADQLMKDIGVVITYCFNHEQPYYLKLLSKMPIT